MVYDDILQYFGSQGFAAAATTGSLGGLNILYNRVGAEAVYCILINNGENSYINKSQILNINYQLCAQVPQRNVLFIVATTNVERDKQLASLSGVNLWLVDSFERQLMIYEKQPDDFYDLKYGITQAITMSRGAKAHNALKWKNFPFVTVGLVLVNIIWFIVLISGGDVSSASYMVSKGAAYGRYIFEDYQFWRLITNMFMHFSISHLAGNMVYLVLAGISLERTAGHIKFFLIYILSGFGASVVSAAYYYIAGQDTVSAGASGAIYGIIGAMVYLLIKNRNRIGSGNLWLRIGIIIIFLFYSNFLNPEIDAVAHIAGFVFGMLLALAFLGTNRRKIT